MELHEAIERDLRAEMLRRGVTVDELAERMGISNKAVYRLLGGIAAKLAPMIRLCSILGIRASEVIQRAEHVAGQPTPLTMETKINATNHGTH